jgi:hypothetical protein
VDQLRDLTMTLYGYDMVDYEMGDDDAVNDTSGACTAGAGSQGVRALQSGDTSGTILNGLAAATGTGGVVSSLGHPDQMC